MEKRYQVFVSSTYEDLKEERQEVIQALLELDCIPAGMELFPAADEDQWSLIKRVIDDSDYYIVVVGGRYGSLGPDGIGYTEKEFDYALATSKPIIAFLHADPGKIPAARSEKTDDGKHKLADFRAKLEKRMVKHWASPSELGSVASRGLVKLIKARPAVGWIRADAAAEELASKELLALRKRIDELEKELASAESAPPRGTDTLAQGDESFAIRMGYQRRIKDARGHENAGVTIQKAWNEIFAVLAPIAVDEANEADLKSRLISWLMAFVVDDSVERWNFNISIHDFETIKVQLLALGLIVESKRKRAPSDKQTYWSLTPYGRNLMVKLRAIPKGVVPAAAT